MTNYTRTQAEDLRLGLVNECKFKNYLKEKENLILIKAKDKYSVFDFKIKDQKTIVELKSRNFNMKRFNTTMVGYNKIKRALQLQDKGWNVYIYFLFCDGLFKWKVNEEQIACTMSACRRDRGKNEYTNQIFRICHR